MAPCTTDIAETWLYETNLLPKHTWYIVWIQVQTVFISSYTTIHCTHKYHHAYYYWPAFSHWTLYKPCYAEQVTLIGVRHKAGMFLSATVYYQQAQSVGCASTFTEEGHLLVSRKWNVVNIKLGALQREWFLSSLTELTVGNEVMVSSLWLR